ncbi:hypothetical protein D3C72_1743770 [compost metagenome]
MPDGPEAFLDGSSHVVGGRIGMVELGMRPLDLLQPPEQPIEFGVADGRLVEDVVAVVVLFDRAAQPLDLLGQVRHRVRRSAQFRRCRRFHLLASFLKFRS